MNNENQDKIEILDPNLKEGFAQTPRVVLRAKGLSRHSKTTYSLLLDYAWQTGSCFPGQKTLAKDLGISIRTVQRDLDELREFGLIDWRQRGNTKTNIYYILSLEFLNKLKAEEKKEAEKPQVETKVSDTTNTSDHEVTDLAVQDTTKVSDIIEEVEYTQNQYKQSLTLGANDNEKIIIKEQGTDSFESFDSEAVEIARELNDLKSIKFYQKLIHQRNKGDIADSDIQNALDLTRKAISESKADKTNFLKNPGGWFVFNLKRLTEKRKGQEQKNKIEELAQKFMTKAVMSVVILFAVFFSTFTLNPQTVNAESSLSAEAILQEHNEIRKEQGLPELKLNPKLSESAHNKTIVMMIEDCWAHYCPSGIEPWAYFRGVEYKYISAGENLAQNFHDTDGVMRAWINNKSHYQNIINPNYTEIGIAILDTKFQGVEHNTIIAVHFGKPKT